MANVPNIYQDHLFQPTVPEVFNAFKEFVARNPIPPSFLEHLQEDRLPFYWQNMGPADSHAEILRSIQSAGRTTPSDAAASSSQASYPQPQSRPHSQPPPGPQPLPPPLPPSPGRAGKEVIGRHDSGRSERQGRAGKDVVNRHDSGRSASQGGAGKDGSSRHDHSGRSASQGGAGKDGSNRHDHSGRSRSLGLAGREGVRSHDRDRSPSPPHDRGRRNRERDRERSRSPHRRRSHHRGRSPSRHRGIRRRHSSRGDEPGQRTSPPAPGDRREARQSRSPTPTSPSDIFRTILPEFDEEFDTMLENPIEPLPQEILDFSSRTKDEKLRADYRDKVQVERKIHEKLIRSTELLLASIDEQNQRAAQEQSRIDGFPSMSPVNESMTEITQIESDLLAKTVEVLTSMQNAGDLNEIQKLDFELAGFQFEIEKNREKRHKLIRQREDLNGRRIKMFEEILETVKASKEVEEKYYREYERGQIDLINELRAAQQKRITAQSGVELNIRRATGEQSNL